MTFENNYIVGSYFTDSVTELGFDLIAWGPFTTHDVLLTQVEAYRICQTLV